MIELERSLNIHCDVIAADKLLLYAVRRKLVHIQKEVLNTRKRDSDGQKPLHAFVVLLLVVTKYSLFGHAVRLFLEYRCKFREPALGTCAHVFTSRRDAASELSLLLQI